MSLPTAFETTAPLEILAVVPGSTSDNESGMTQSSCEVQVMIPKTQKTGFHRASLLCRWPDGKVVKQPFAWEVIPHLEASPAGLVLGSREGPTKVSVRVASDGRPFRVRAVTGRLISGTVILPRESALAHTLNLTIDPSRSTGKSSERDLLVVTDHPEQPTLTVSVLLLPNG